MVKYKTYLSLALSCVTIALLSDSFAAEAPPSQSQIVTDTRSDEVLEARAQDELLIGTWEGIDHASESIYGTLKVTRTHISWRGCKTRYSIVMKSVGPTYPDQLPLQRTVKTRKYVTLKLKLEPNECLLSEQAYLQFSFATDIPGYAAVIEYAQNGTPEGWISFGKR